jgi:DUF1680 family protein
VGGSDDAGVTFPFIDSDVYKWLEAVGWELGRAPDAELERAASDVIDLVASAQRPDGYLNTYVQLSGRQPFSDLQWGHELYCVGHCAGCRGLARWATTVSSSSPSACRSRGAGTERAPGDRRSPRSRWRS